MLRKVFYKILKFIVKLIEKIKNFFRKKYSISLLDEWWKSIDGKGNLKLRYLPRKDEIIYFPDLNKYYQVINVIHYLGKKHGIFLVVKDFTK